jgi:CRP-like cAMP-binding protein
MAQPSPSPQDFLRDIPLFSLLDASELSALLPLVRPIQLSKGDVLFAQGDRGTAMWVLTDTSEVAISAMRPQARFPVAIAYAAAGETIGEMAMIDSGPRSGTATVAQGGGGFRIEASDFESLRKNFHPAAYKVLRQICINLCSRLRATSDRVVPPGNMTLTTPSRTRGTRVSPALIEAFPPFRALPQVVRLALAQKLTWLEFTSVTPICAEGEDADAAYFVVDGQVDVGRNGRTLATMRLGDVFGLIGVIDQGRRSASCVTAGPAKLLRLDKPDFNTLFTSGNRFAFQLVNLVACQLVGHLRATNELLPQPGASSPASPIADDLSEDLLPEAEVLPLELEIELDDKEVG